MMGAGSTAGLLGTAAGCRPRTLVAASWAAFTGISCAGGLRGRSNTGTVAAFEADCCFRCHGKKLQTGCNRRCRLIRRSCKASGRSWCLGSERTQGPVVWGRDAASMDSCNLARVDRPGWGHAVLSRAMVVSFTV